MSSEKYIGLDVHQATISVATATTCQLQQPIDVVASQ